MFDNDKLWGRIKMVLFFAMGFVYIFLGTMIIVKQWFLKELQPIFSWSLGIVIILYGIHRIYRLYRPKNS